MHEDNVKVAVRVSVDLLFFWFMRNVGEYCYGSYVVSVFFVCLLLDMTYWTEKFQMHFQDTAFVSS